MDLELPEIPPKLVNAFVDEDGDVRVKEDSLRDVLSRFRSFSAEAASKVLDTLRLEFLEEIRTLRNASELARGDLKQESWRRNSPARTPSRTWRTPCGRTRWSWRCTKAG
ncbi:unnamed protein product [Effrenium voratum]|uniref:Uncharacterized protein n=1 Tax=Effrenium voratum TaxID=2562239 RepID=A0AA36HRC1_9DINO|nr:unnamed protein product [Effrenium voratum]